MKKFLRHFRLAFLFAIAMFVICGFIYPMVLTGVSQVVFPSQSNGSLVEVDGKAVGSEIVGQDFTDERLFHADLQLTTTILIHKNKKIVENMLVYHLK